MNVEEKLKIVLEKIEKGEINKNVVIGYARFYITVYDSAKQCSEVTEFISESDNEFYYLCKELLKVLVCH